MEGTIEVYCMVRLYLWESCRLMRWLFMKVPRYWLFGVSTQHKCIWYKVLCNGCCLLFRFKTSGLQKSKMNCPSEYITTRNQLRHSLLYWSKSILTFYLAVHLFILIFFSINSIKCTFDCSVWPFIVLVCFTLPWNAWKIIMTFE